MEKSVASALFVGWEEMFVTNTNGRKEVYYYLKRKDGGSDLAVVGKERSVRHMFYYYALRNRSVLLSLAPSSSLVKLRSRRDVVDWLSSVVPDSPSHQSSQSIDDSLESEDGHDSDPASFSNLYAQNLGNYPKEVSWFGSSWTCRKRRRHYPSFFQNGFTISVHDFVYIMAEENKRLVAYLEDLYVDTKGNKMAVVRWFHKIDEIGFVLHADFSDREIFFSLCLQDLSVECIDGLATILGAQHFKKFQNMATHTRWEPFVCHRMVDNDDVKPFDITQVQGYWKQEILRYMYTTFVHRTNVKPLCVDGGLEVEGNGDDDSIRTRPKKIHCASRGGEMDQQLPYIKEVKDVVCWDIPKSRENLVISCSSAELCAPKESRSGAGLSRKDLVKQRSSQHMAVGSHVEVFSQDSGIRGCWFRALVLKKHKDKVKVQYQDIRDAVDEENHVEEWILASKVVVPDYLGFHLSGRTVLRPYPPSNKGRFSWNIHVGTALDAWWCDGWWEGIVVQKESEDRIHVFLPGESRKLIFGRGDLRRSQDWIGNKWKYIKRRPDIVTSVPSGQENSQDGDKFCDNYPLVTCKYSLAGNQADVYSLLLKNDNSVCDMGGVPKALEGSLDKVAPISELQDDGRKESDVPNLAKDGLLAQLKWKSSRKRRRSRERLPRRGSSDSKHHNDSGSSCPENAESPPCDRFLIPKPLKLDHENCKYVGDVLFNTSVPPLASLVMSR